MALKITFPIDWPLLRYSSNQQRTYYTKIRSLHLEDGIVAGSIPLWWRAVDANDQPTGDPLVMAPDLQAAIIWKPRELMMKSGEGISTYSLAYGCVVEHLKVVCGPDVLIEPLL